MLSSTLQILCYYTALSFITYFSDNFLLFLPTFQHKNLYRLLLTFSEQASSLVFNAFEGSHRLFVFCITASRLPNITRRISTQTYFEQPQFMVVLGTLYPEEARP